MALCIAQDPAADAVLNDPEVGAFALLVGMMLDQQFPMETAFAGPAKVLARFGSLDPRRIADADPEAFAELCSQTPAIHRFPGSMARRLQDLAALVAEQYDADASRIWSDAESGRQLFTRLTALPGFGAQKAKIFIALLAKQLGIRPDGWEQVAGDYARNEFRSVADVTGPESLHKVRDFKKAAKARARLAAE